MQRMYEVVITVIVNDRMALYMYNFYPYVCIRRTKTTFGFIHGIQFAYRLSRHTCYMI
jgi:hypothetical protein